MIDSIENFKKPDPAFAGNLINAKKGNIMDIEELKTEHSALFNQVLDLGKQQEVQRAAAMIELGEAAGALDLSIELIKSGAEHSATINAKFAAAQLKNQTFEAMSADNADTSDIDATPDQNVPLAIIDPTELAAIQTAKDMGVKIQ
jgi:hypothetical protein